MLDEVFVISGIIKVVEVSFISRSRRKKYIFIKKIVTNALSLRAQFIFDKPCSYFAVRELDFALGNHGLCAQPKDYSLIC